MVRRFRLLSQQIMEGTLIGKLHQQQYLAEQEQVVEQELEKEQVEE